MTDPHAGANSEGSRWTHPAAILVATDLSDLERLMPYALEQAAETGARLMLLHVLASGAAITVDAAGVPNYNPSEALAHASGKLEPWCQAARRLHIACDALVREGDPAQLITASVDQFHADRVLLGSRRQRRLGGQALGSVAENVLRSVAPPVFTVGPEAHRRPQEPVEESVRQKVVVHATSLREVARPSAALACRMAASQGAKLILLHVLPAHAREERRRKGLMASTEEAALHELRLLADGLNADASTDVEPRVLRGNPAIEILAEAAEHRAGLIVLGATTRSAFVNLPRNRVIFQLLAHARCPVLTLREPLA